MFFFRHLLDQTANPPPLIDIPPLFFIDLALWVLERGE